MLLNAGSHCITGCFLAMWSIYGALLHISKVQCVRKVAVHLGVWVAISRRRIVGPWTSLPTAFISAQRLSELTVLPALLKKTSHILFAEYPPLESIPSQLVTVHIPIFQVIFILILSPNLYLFLHCSCPSFRYF
jgi:hypothetical protein